MLTSPISPARQSIPVLRDPWSIRTAVMRIVQSDRLLDGPSTDDRRAFTRLAVKIGLDVTPVVYEANLVLLPQDCGDTIPALASDISLGGIGFMHDDPFSTQHALITLDVANDGLVTLLIEVRWTRDHGQSAHLSGGRFLGVTEVPWFLRESR